MLEGGPEAYARCWTSPSSVTDAGETAGAFLNETLRQGVRIGRRRVDSSVETGLIVELPDGSLGARFDGEGDIAVDKSMMAEFRLIWLLSDAALELEHDCAMRLRRALRRDNVIIYDTTHATSRFGLKLGCFVTVGSDMRTKIIAMSVVACEDKESFEWVFTKFIEGFRFAPSVIFTDGDHAMRAAIASIFTTSKHLLCIFHLSLNLSAHFRRLLGPDMYPNFSRRFWRICLETDLESRGSFQEEWLAFTAMAEASRTGSNAQKLDQALLWLQALAERREQWAARWTWEVCSYGVRSTQRSEAIHSAIKQFLRSSGLLTELLNNLSEYSRRIQQEQRTDECRAEQRLNRGGITTSEPVPPIVTHIAESLTPAAFDILREQALLSGSYYICDEPGEERAWRVSFTIQEACDDRRIEPASDADRGDILFASTIEGGRDHRPRGHITTLLTCSCQFPTMRGIPCRHIIKAHIHARCTSFQFIFAPLWRRTTELQLSARVRSMSLMRISALALETRARGAISESLDDRRGRLVPIFRQLLDTIGSHGDCDVVEQQLRSLVSQAKERGDSSGVGARAGVSTTTFTADGECGNGQKVLNAVLRKSKQNKRRPNAGMVHKN